MNTDQLIHALASDLRSAGPHRRWSKLAVMTALASTVTLAAILLLFARSPHFEHGPSATVLFSASAGLALAIVAFRAALKLSSPEGNSTLWGFLIPPAILLTGLVLEMVHTPESSWADRLWGEDSTACFCCVVALSLPILAGALIALRDSAPARPWLSGLMAGLLAGGIAAALYTLHCPEDSLLFVATWLVLAIVAVSVGGALAASRVLRW
jgi:hypothetical protein